MNLPAFPAHHAPFPHPRHVVSRTFCYVQRLLVFLAVCATLFAPRLSDATIVIPVADTDLARQASVIVIGRITKITSAWDKDHEKIFTKLTLSVDETLKGKLKKHRLTVTQLGGIVGDIESWIDGNPEFTDGEKVLLFLSRNDNGSFQV